MSAETRVQEGGEWEAREEGLQFIAAASTHAFIDWAHVSRAFPEETSREPKPELKCGVR